MMAPIETNFDGSVDANQIEKTIKPDDPHCPISKLLSLENTVSGKVQTVKKISACASVAKKFGLSVHMDGARIMNAAIKLDLPVKTLVKDMDSISLCLSKGLGAPVGSVLVGSKNLIEKAYRIRKIVGGGLRQSGVLAAAGLYAIEENIGRLAVDHKNACLLARRLQKIPKISVNIDDVQTNMVFVDIPEGSNRSLKKYLLHNGILINAESKRIRLVTHLDINSKKIDYFIEKMESFFS